MTNERRRMIGTVVSARMTKSVVVRVDHTVRHRLYGKVVHRSSKFMAHDPLGCRLGDKVELVESRPLSHSKRWVVEKIVQGGQQVAVSPDAANTGGAA
jgi:small subunit ribosomal protein S17